MGWYTHIHYVDARRTFLKLADFLNFGGIAGDKFVPSPEVLARRSSVSVPLLVPIVYYGKSYSELKV